MKTIYLGQWPFPRELETAQQEWLDKLPKMQRTGSYAYTYTGSKIIFRRNEDAVAFRLKFEL